MRLVPACLAAFAVAVGGASPGGAAEPRSAIPWLSQSIELHATLPPPSRAPENRRIPGDETIRVTPLAPTGRDAVGLLPPEETGFAPALWGRATAAEIRTLLLAHPDQGVPAARALFRRILLAEAEPPRGSDASSPVLLARIDRLLAIGALEEAGALIAAAGPDTPGLFRRWFDIGLLLDRAAPPCAALRENPSLSPTLPARVFCLARGGDWNAAEITLTLGERVGSIPDGQQALLARFLDPALFEEEPEPPAPEPLTPLDFLMREAVGLPRPPGQLPLAFLHTDLGEHVPMRTRAEAAERLVLSGAVEPPVLFAAYRSGAPAASGGIWERAGAVQALGAALATGDDVAIAPALVEADALLSARGLRPALAEAYARDLARLDAAALAPAARRSAVELLLLAGDPRAAREKAGAEPDARTAGLFAVAGLGAAPGLSGDAMLDAALDGLSVERPADERERGLAETLAAGRQGQAILEALELLAPGPGVDPQSLRAALLTLRLAGQTASARAIALETLLSGSAG